ncbi:MULTISPECIES: hypothetical protein [unclassified Streptomyces]|uniref:hypothetical protein n=1 Tax=unclassified Streptomyces TaxID=2593676 RepID=UPI0016530DF8|nr:hypothetical protein [Streptomyces sp. sk2.1]
MVWPQAEILPGVTVQILTRRLEELEVPRLTKEISRGELDGHLVAAVRPPHG